MSWLKTTPFLILILSGPTCAPGGSQSDPYSPHPDGGTDDSTDTQTDSPLDSGTDTDTDVDTDTDTDGDTDTDSDIDTDTDVDTESDSDTGTDTDTGSGDTDTDADTEPPDPCAGPGTWLDTGWEGDLNDDGITDIVHLGTRCWQDPPAPDTMTWAAAVAYCDDLVLTGYDDWQLPTVNHLRLLGRPNTFECASCGLVDPGDLEEADIEDCEACLPLLGGPGAGGCYWPAELAEVGCTSFIGFVHWSSSELWADDYNAWAWSFDGNYPGTGARAKTAIASVRCVRPL